MSENVEMGYILTSSIDGTAMLLKGSAYVVKETLKLIQYMIQKVKNRELSPGEYRNFTSFIRRAQGNLSYLNIPAENKSYVRMIEQDLKRLKVPFYILPKSGAKTGMLQIVYPERYKSIVQGWFERYCTRRLENGDFKNEQVMKDLAGGEARTGILTIPTEEKSLLNEMRKDLDKLHVSYYLMPDTNIGDGTREVLYAKKDEEKIKHWFDGFCAKHIRQGGEKSVQELQAIAGNKSQIGFINIPANNTAVIEKMREEFQRLGINYHVMEDMKTGDGLIQVMYLKKDEVAVRNWYSNYATDQLLRGGRHEYRDLMNLTNGKAQLVNIPISESRVGAMLEDFSNLHINYSIMPNLKINDKGIMVLYAAADADRVKGWYKMYQENILQTKEPAELQEMSMQDYIGSASMQVDDYMKSASQEPPDKVIPSENLEIPEEIPENFTVDEVDYGKSVNNESTEDYPDFIKEIPEEPTTLHFNDKNMENSRESHTTDPNFLKFDADPSYQKVTINESLVVESGKDTFISKIPGLQDSYLLCSAQNVFETDFHGENKGKTFVAFISKQHRQMICDKKGNLKPSIDSKELLSHFDPVKRGFEAVKNLQKGNSIKPELIKR